jgi:hypothetical protein
MAAKFSAAMIMCGIPRLPVPATPTLAAHDVGAHLTRHRVASLRIRVAAEVLTIA